MTVKESEDSFKKMVEDFKSRYLKIWWESSSQFPELGAPFTRMQQRLKEKELDKRVKEISSEMKEKPFSKERKFMWREKIKWAMREVAGDSVGFKSDELSSLVIDRFSESADNLISEAKSFNPRTNIKEINQAVRNLWIANSIQFLLDKEVKLTPSTFAYSMLYPYTDNYLDSPLISTESKKLINCRFKMCLSGETVAPANLHEDSLFKLVHIIEDEYPRDSSAKVFESLLAIHEAQGKSLLQQGMQTSPYEDDIIGISFEKGGTSVLADAFLVDNLISMSDACFMFGYGVFLQLVDDVEDSREDFLNMHMTVFSQLFGKWPLDTMTNKLFNFISSVLEVEEGKPPANLRKLEDVIRKNSNFLVFEAITKNREAYSRKYVKKIEKYSPFSFLYINKLKKKIKKNLKVAEGQFSKIHG